MLLTGLCSALCLGGEAFGQKEPPAKPKAKAQAEDLLSAKAFPIKWQHVSSDKKAELVGTWDFDKTLKVPELKCTGKPPGYVRTVEKFENFDLTLEWHYDGDKNCNSGILVHCNDDKVWPACIQVQLHWPEAGSIFPMTGASAAAKVMVTGLKLDLKVWHTCRVLSNNGTITVWIDGKRVGQVAQCKPSSGYIGLQSEGYPIRFRKFEITRLPGPKKAKPKPPAKKVLPPKVKPKTAFFGGPGRPGSVISRRALAPGLWESQNEPGASARRLTCALPCDAVCEKRRNCERKARRCAAFVVKRSHRCPPAAPCRDSSAPADRAPP